MEVVLLVEVELESLRVVLEAKIPEVEWDRARFEELTLMDEKRLRAAFNMELYQRRIAHAFNMKFKPRKIKKEIWF